MEVVIQKTQVKTHPSASYYVLKGQSTQWLFKKESRRPENAFTATSPGPNPAPPRA
jgi:hypothetical protein